MHVKSTKGPIDVYLCEVEKEKPGAKTCEDMDTVSSETETSFYPDEGNVLLLHFYPHVVVGFLVFLRLSYHSDKVVSCTVEQV